MRNLEIGERIRQIRIHQGLTQTELIKDICSNTYISKIESGKTKPSYSFILKVSKVLNVEPQFLINVNETNIEPDIHKVYETYRQTGEISPQDLSLLKLHTRENYSNTTLVKIYYVLISYYIKTDISEARPFVEQAKNTINHSGTEKELSYYFNSLSRFFYFTKNYSEALSYAVLHLNSLDSSAGRLREGKAYFNLTTIRTKIDEDLELARIYSKKALHLFELEDFKQGIGSTLTELAIQYHRNGLYDEALETLDKLNTFSDTYRKDFYAPILEYNFGRIYHKLKRYEQAIEHYYNSIELDELAGEKYTIYAIKCLAEISIEQKNWEEASDFLLKGFSLTSKYLLPHMHIQLLHLRSQIYKTRFDFPAYEKEMQQAVQLALDGEYPLSIKEISIELADHYNEARAYKMAAKYYKIALKV